MLNIAFFCVLDVFDVVQAWVYYITYWWVWVKVQSVPPNIYHPVGSFRSPNLSDVTWTHPNGWVKPCRNTTCPMNSTSLCHLKPSLNHLKTYTILYHGYMAKKPSLPSRISPKKSPLAEWLVICSAKPTMRAARDSPPVLRNSPRAQGNLKKWRKPRGKFMGIPFGKHTNNYEKSPFLLGKSTISTGPFSIAFCMFTRPGIMDFWRLSWESMENTVKKSLQTRKCIGEIIRTCRGISRKQSTFGGNHPIPTPFPPWMFDGYVWWKYHGDTMDRTYFFGIHFRKIMENISKWNIMGIEWE